MQEKLGVLVFCPTKSRCESVALAVASAIKSKKIEINHIDLFYFISY